MYVVKRDGKQEAVAFDKITRRIEQLCEGLDKEFVDPSLVAQKVVEGVFKGVTTSEIDNLAAETCAYMSQMHPDFSVLAARIAISSGSVEVVAGKVDRDDVRLLDDHAGDAEWL